MAGEEPTKSEFETWLSPKAALDFLPSEWSQDAAEQWIGQRLPTGLIRSACRQHAMRDKPTVIEPYLIPASLWEGWPLHAEPEFWTTGDIALYERRTSSGRFLGKFFDVRFDPAPFAAAFPAKPAPSDEPAPARRQDLPLLPEPIAQAWASWFKGQPGGGSKEAAEKAAREMFPNHNLSRERIRDLIGPSIMGRPQKTKK